MRESQRVLPRDDEEDGRERGLKTFEEAIARANCDSEFGVCEAIVVQQGKTHANFEDENTRRSRRPARALTGCAGFGLRAETYSTKISLPARAGARRLE